MLTFAQSEYAIAEASYAQYTTGFLLLAGRDRHS